MGTDFENKTHEEMLEWLDHANSGEIQVAADRLMSAASEIRKIAEELKVRPQLVEWKGEGAKAFHTWSADLANATLRLGDYSEATSKSLGEASNAIALAQASIPRTEASAQANLEAALAARNDPDASAVAKKSAETLIASREKNREEAAARMRSLSQTYTYSSDQMTSLDRPVFPAMPQTIAPQAVEGRDGEQGGHIGPGAGSAVGGTGYAIAPGHSTGAVAGVTAPAGGVSISPHTVSRPVDMGIDGLAVLPEAPSSPVANPVAPPTGPRPDTVLPSTVGIIPPVPNISPSAPRSTSGGGRTTGMPRPPVSAPGVSPLGPGPVGRPAGPNGITGGRVVPPNSGRPAVGIPRGTVIGSENAHGTAPIGRASGMGGGVGPGISPNAAGGGRRLAGEMGGVVGGRQQQGRAGLRPFTPGGSGLVRGSASGDAERGTGLAGRGGGIAPQGPRAHATGRDEGGERPDYLVEDDETWQQGGRRVVPPVID
ncbi:WXG100 family type VII secretion target [Streptomyces atratus]|uniref:WXG100 family type VII secretion target n=1 Tax=Streptomyces atratus TaxID=1893 RepID=UPI00224E6C5D|nr:translation initiation factor IF-2 [Streptomyces atratus]MCX5343245.1 translation initiation factor IF-2 [Streptomyces atratus]